MIYEQTKQRPHGTLTTAYKDVYGYVRVSDTKQEKGVSKEAQQEAISHYANQNQLNVVKWFIETRTAAKTGRPEFNAMIKDISDGKATGFIGHKIDRTSRNLDDWSRMVKLHDLGYEIHFAHENIDLSERSGRLSADIQLIMACDYIRNLRQETIKGLYQRLKDGCYPFGAPIGYVNNGKGKLKTPHDVQARHVKKLFELYATGNFSHRSLVPVMYERGLRNHRGNKVGKTGIANILNNPFYTGLMKVKDQTFVGKHKPLISLSLFKRVQDFQSGKTIVRTTKHEFIFRRLLHCQICNNRLIGELQKGRVYYRCQRKNCTNVIREDAVEQQIKECLSAIEFTQEEADLLSEFTSEYAHNWQVEQEHLEHSLSLEFKSVSSRISKLTDVYLEGGIEKEIFNMKKQELDSEMVSLHERKDQLAKDSALIFQEVQNFLELAGSLVKSYNSAEMEEKRELLQNVFSNLSVHEKKLCISIASPYSELIKEDDALKCAPNRDGHRTFCQSKEDGVNAQAQKKTDLKALFRRLMHRVESINR